MLRSLFGLLVAGSLSSVIASPGLAVGVTFSLDPLSYVSSNAAVPSDSGYLFQEIASLPGSGSLHTSVGGNSATTAYDASSSGMTFDFDDTRTGPFFSTAGGTVGIYFSVDAPVDYVLSGSYTAVDPDAGHVLFGGSLEDLTDSVSLFSNTQGSFDTPNESFTLGLLEGDNPNYNYLLGSLTGSLIPGHLYHVRASSFIQQFEQGTDSGASGTGTFSLVFVPEPGTGLLLLTGIAGLGVLRRHRHR